MYVHSTCREKNSKRAPAVCSLCAHSRTTHGTHCACGSGGSALRSLPSFSSPYIFSEFTSANSVTCVSLLRCILLSSCPLSIFSTRSRKTWVPHILFCFRHLLRAYFSIPTMSWMTRLGTKWKKCSLLGELVVLEASNCLAQVHNSTLREPCGEMWLLDRQAPRNRRCLSSST